MDRVHAGSGRREREGMIISLIDCILAESRGGHGPHGGSFHA